ncbi:STAS domain-containing protein [Candidatus Bathyarchaeota archaeon]|jgi:anti-anti-sigma factor|nr:STAS domain-containing protein [Candidatus Bathyarchaeota archaeon]MBT7914312.1 STAS domain-containing protein [Candidatus Bathyarchaeota archaeon]
MTTLTAEVEHRKDVSVIQLSGYLSSEVAGPLEDAFLRIADFNKIVLTFHEKDFINSAGLAVLFDLILPLKDKGKVFRVVHPAAHFRKVFDIVGLSKDVDVFESEELAMEGW